MNERMKHPAPAWAAREIKARDAEIERLKSSLQLFVDRLKAQEAITDKFAAEIERLKEENDGLRDHLKAFEDSGGVAAHAEVFRRGADIKRLREENTRLRSLVEFEPDLEAALAKEDKP